MLFNQTMILRTLRCRNRNMPGVLGRLLTMIGDQGGYVGEIETVSFGNNYAVRDIDILCENEAILQKILDAVKRAPDVDVLEVRDEVMDIHRGGKICSQPTHPIRSVADLRKVYTPGVADVSRAVVERPELAEIYSSIGSTVAICTNGSRVLGLGNIGPEASMPVMEGKAALLTQFVGLNAWPVLIGTRDINEFVETVVKISSTFAAIHLEDIETPACFEIEEKLIERLNKPVMHDDQHGTAVAALAAVISACKEIGMDLATAKVGQVGLGAAGFAISRLVAKYTGQPVKGCDRNSDAVARFKAGGGIESSMDDILVESDIVLMTTGVKGLLKPDRVRKGSVVMALSNPNPEIDPQEAMQAGAAIAVDGRSVNNILGYPGIWKGALDAKASRIVPEMLIAAAEAIAQEAHGDDELLPSPLNLSVHRSVAAAVARAAMKAGVAQKTLDEDYFHHIRGEQVIRTAGPS